MENSGEYGGRVLRAFKGDGMSFIAGGIITPDVAMSWPLNNRLALHKQGNIEWFGPPAVEEQAAREAGSPAPKRGKVGAKVDAPAKPATATRRQRQ